MSFFEELKRRNVIRVAIAYLITAWLVAQVLELLFDSFGTPDWVMKTILVLMAVGFVFTLVFAWAYELTPEGIKRDVKLDRSESIAPLTARRLDRTIIIVLVLAVGYFAWEARFKGSGPINQAEQVAGKSATEVNEPTPIATTPSIAVLPFADLSPKGDQGYFSAGIAEELLNLLVGVDGLTVASRTSSFAYKGSTSSIADIAADLKVDHILEGSVRKADNQVRITAQLIDADTDRHLWSDTYDRELNDIFAIQDEIANAIVDALKAELGMLADAGPIDVQAATENLDAYDLYLEARSLFIARKDVGHSIELYRRAVELDPQFARAWEDLAAALAIADGWNVKLEDPFGQSREAAQRALSLDDSLSMAWAAMGLVSFNRDRDLVRALDEMTRATEADPRNATAWFWKGSFLSMLGFTDRGIDHLERCLALEPEYLNCQRHITRMHSINGDLDRALDLYEQNLRLGFSNNEFWMIPIYVEKGMTHAALLLLLAESQGDREYPFVALMDALENPGKERPIGIAEMRAWIERNELDPKWYTGEFIALGAYGDVQPSFDGNIMWQKFARPFRESTEFRPFLERSGILRYWREVEWPPQCRPLGDEDFECD